MTLSDRPIHLLDPFESRLDEGNTLHTVSSARGFAIAGIR